MHVKQKYSCINYKNVCHFKSGCTRRSRFARAKHRGRRDFLTIHMGKTHSLQGVSEKNATQAFNSHIFLRNNDIKKIFIPLDSQYYGLSKEKTIFLKMQILKEILRIFGKY